MAAIDLITSKIGFCWPEATRSLWEMVGQLSPPMRTIESDGSPYLSRFYLLHEHRDILPGVFLHYFHRSDMDAEFHNHPWEWGYSLILAGGYKEQRLVDGQIVEQTYKPGDTNLIKSDTFHRVELLEPGCWTLFTVGPGTKQSWGFKNAQTGQFENWRDFIERTRGYRPKEE